MFLFILSSIWVASVLAVFYILTGVSLTLYVRSVSHCMCFAGKGQINCFVVLRVLITSVIYFQTLSNAQCWSTLNVLTTEIVMSYQYYQVTVGVSVM